MCGEIQNWQHTKQFSLRVTSGAVQQLSLSDIFHDCEEVWLDEFLITGFNGGASGACYMKVDASNFTQGARNNEQVRGTMLSVDVLNPHVVFQRPRVVLRSSMSTLQTLEFSLFLSDGTPVAFTEANFHFTVVMRKPKEAIAAERLLMGSFDFPSRFDPAKNYYAPYLK